MGVEPARRFRAGQQWGDVSQVVGRQCVVGLGVPSGMPTRRARRRLAHDKSHRRLRTRLRRSSTQEILERVELVRLAGPGRLSQVRAGRHIVGQHPARCVCSGVL